MRPLHPFPARASCGRADLVRALAWSGETLATVADLLDYEKANDSVVPATVLKIQIDIDSVSSQFSTALESEPCVSPPSEIPFWYLAAVEYQEKNHVEARPKDRDGPTALPVWAQGPSVQPPFCELTAWRDLVPRLRCTLTERCESREPNVPAIVERLGHGDSLERLPRRARRRWGHGATVIEDRSERLTPYWRDQGRARAMLARLFPRHAFERWLYWDDFAAPVAVPVSGGIERRVRRMPPVGRLVVVLGDLGLLARADENVRRYWADFGHRLREAGCRPVALTPADPQSYPTALSQCWQLVAWERSANLVPGVRSETAVERLLTLLSPASRIEPGLLREMRLLAGYAAAVESMFWQHPALSSTSSVAATPDAQAARRWRAEFMDLDEATQREALETIRRWRGGLRPEIWYAEVQGLERGLRDRLIDPEDVRLSRECFAALGRWLQGVGDWEPPTGLAAWFRFVEPRLPEGYRDDPNLGAHFERLWRLAHAHEARSASVLGYDPGRFLSDTALRRVVAWQDGETLNCAEIADQTDRNPGGSPVAWFETRNGEIQIEPLAVEPAESLDRNAFWKSGQPPSWADDWGTDDYGPWVTFSIEDQWGNKVTQRMRWIKPGKFQMGSPDDEPERYRDEGPKHSVTIGHGFWLFDTACTQALWKAVMGKNPSRFKGDDRPVENVNWNGCQGFLKQLNARRPGLNLGLPSEAQWEYACRAGTTTSFSFGANITPKQVNYDGNHPYADGETSLYRKETVPVASLPPNPWGLYEMHGNVWEWCQDHWRDHYQGAPTDGSAWEDLDVGAPRVLRGGSWYGGARDVRSSYRFPDRPGLRLDFVGFRCARVRVMSPASPEGAEPTGSARGRLPERRPERGPSGGVIGAEPMLLRLDSGESPARCPLPQASAFLIRTDREQLTFRRITKPAWASAIGRDCFGLWCKIEVDPGIGEPVIQRLRWIPPGRFWMGSPEEETRGLVKNDYKRKWFEHEHPRHLVTLTGGFWLFDTPCTQALWKAVMGNNPSRFQSLTRPLEQISWYDAQDFVARINGQIADLNLTLPSEAQWEYACRAGTETAIYTGDLFILGHNDAPVLDPIAWYSGNSGVDFDLNNGHDSSDWSGKRYPHTKAGARPVKLKRANPWGLHDMLGNVWEWCQDGMRRYGAEAQTNPIGSLEAGAARVLRGGSWDDRARFVRSACRFSDDPGLRVANIGFRCARVS